MEHDKVEFSLTDAFIDKTFAKIQTECDGWRSEYIPRLFSTLYHDLVTEETWNAVKKYKNPTINFKLLQNLIIYKVKETKKNLF